jgi:hypothetical protein
MIFSASLNPFPMGIDRLYVLLLNFLVYPEMRFTLLSIVFEPYK